VKIHIEEIQWSWDHPVVQELLLKYYRDRLFSTPECADETVQQVFALAPTEPPAAVLDVGCGLGYHAASFAKLGFDVMAFDPGDRYIALAEGHASTQDLRIDIRQMTCNNLEEVKRFDLAWAGAYCPGQLSPSEVTDDFRRICDALIPGRPFVATVAGKARPPFRAKAKDWEQMEDCFVLEEEWTDETFCYENSWFVYPAEGRVIKVIEVDRIYGVKEIVPLLRRAGFADIETYRDLLTKAPAEPGRHFAFRCRRPEM
jgi:SAM-dependent methyltransferase